MPGERCAKSAGRQARHRPLRHVPCADGRVARPRGLTWRTAVLYSTRRCEAPRVGDFDTEMVEDFFRAVSNTGGITLHIASLYGRNTHHIIEGLFKAFGRALRKAREPDPRMTGIPSTKGSRKRMIAIIDYGVGNLRSVQKAFELMGQRGRSDRRSRAGRAADKVVLLGVGASQARQRAARAE